jgi:hypothetical protein
MKKNLIITSLIILTIIFVGYLLFARFNSAYPSAKGSINFIDSNFTEAKLSLNAVMKYNTSVADNTRGIIRYSDNLGVTYIAQVKRAYIYQDHAFIAAEIVSTNQNALLGQWIALVFVNNPKEGDYLWHIFTGELGARRNIDARTYPGEKIMVNSGNIRIR